MYRGVWGDIVGNERIIYLESNICWKYIRPAEKVFTLEDHPVRKVSGN